MHANEFDDHDDDDDDDDDDDETDGAIDMKVHESLASTSRRTFQCAQFSQTAQDLHTPD